MNEEQKRKLSALRAARERINQYDLPSGMNACLLGIGIYCYVVGEDPKFYQFGKPQEFAKAINDMYSIWADRQAHLCPVPRADLIRYLNASVEVYEALSGREVKGRLVFQVVDGEKTQMERKPERYDDFTP